MKNLLINFVFFFVGLLMAGGMVFLFLKDSSGKESTNLDAAQSAVRLLSVNTMFVTPQDSFSITRRFQGRITSRKVADLGFSRSGTIEEVLISPGQSVRKGKVLAKLTSGLELDAPFRGSISARLKTVGSVVSPGMPVVRMLDPDDLEARINIPANFASELIEEEPYDLEIGGDTYLIPVSGISPEVDQATRTRTVLFNLPERVSSEHLHGESVSFALVKKVNTKGFWVPVSALSRELRGRWSVYTLSPENGSKYRVQNQYVDVIHSEDDQAWINGPIGEKVHIIPDGIHRVVPGQIVNIAGENSDGK